MSEFEKKKRTLQYILDMIDTSTPRQQKVMRLRLGIPEDREFTEFERNLPLDEVHNYIKFNPHTLEETANELGMTVQRIRQIEALVLRSRVRCVKRKKLKDYLD